MTIKFASKLDRVEIRMLISSDSVLNVKAGLIKLCGKYLTAPDFTSDDMGTTMHGRFFEKYGEAAVRLRLATYYKKSYLRYDFNPQDVSSESFKAFIKATELMGVASYHNVLHKGRLSKFEIAVDYIGLHTTGHLFHRPYVAHKDPMTDGKQMGGTYYFGSLKSEVELVIYDKAEEQNASGIIPTFHKLLRVEAKCRPKNLSVHELASIPNHFNKLIICSQKGLQAIYFPPEPHTWRDFINRSYIHGVRNALKSSPEKYRKKFLLLLKNNQVGWWKPHTLLDGFPERAAKQLHYVPTNK